MSYQLKLLSGTLNGVEYALANGDTVFHIGSHRDLVEGRVAQVLGGVDNAFFLPEELAPAAFVLQVSQGTDSTVVRLGEREGEDQPWCYRPIHTQAVVCAAGLYFAVRADDEAWAPEVLQFTPPAPLAAVVPDPEAPAKPATLGVRYRHRGMILVWMVLLAMAAIGVGAAWFYWQYTPEVRMRGLATVLRDAPADYQILPDADGRLYAFSDDANAKVWGERASRRLQRKDDVFVLRRAEVTRLEQLLIRAGVAVVVVRLDNPAQPQVVISGRLDSTLRESVQSLVNTHAPYVVRPAQVSAITDTALVVLAQQQLRALGISSRTEPDGQRVSVVNDAFLDDAALNAMVRSAERFRRQWGQRRITIHPQLWDDLLQGRSFRYSPGQLLSVGDGRWNYARAIDGSASAVP